MMVRRCVSPLTAVGTEGYSRVTIKGYSPGRIKGGPAIQTIGMPGGWSLLLAGVILALAAITGAAWLHEARTPSVAQTAAQAATQTINVRAIITQPPALTGDEERFATDLWVVHREATRSAVAMSFAGIAYHTEERDQRSSSLFSHISLSGVGGALNKHLAQRLYRAKLRYLQSGGE